MKNKIIKIVKWYLIIHIAVSSVLLIDYTFFVKESTKITWEGRSYPIAKMILLGRFFVKFGGKFFISLFPS